MAQPILLLEQTARGRIQGLCTLFACPRGTFIELLVTAPWNLLGPDDPPDPRTLRGAGTALVAAASSWSTARGRGGVVALQAASQRAAAFYERLGFRRMRPEDDPLSLVPPGDGGWSPEILRVAAGRPGSTEREMPWLLLEPGRAHSAMRRPRPRAPDSVQDEPLFDALEALAIAP